MRCIKITCRLVFNAGAYASICRGMVELIGVANQAWHKSQSRELAVFREANGPEVLLRLYSGSTPVKQVDRLLWSQYASTSTF
jgi:hypothetical protein